MHITYDFSHNDDADIILSMCPFCICVLIVTSSLLGSQQ